MACMRNTSLGKDFTTISTAPHALTCCSGDIVGAINITTPGQFGPVVDGPSGIMPDLPSRLLAKDRFASDVEFVGGHCTHDGRTFAGDTFPGGRPEQFVTDDDIRRLVFSRWPGVVRIFSNC